MAEMQRGCTEMVNIIAAGTWDLGPFAATVALDKYFPQSNKIPRNYR